VKPFLTAGKYTLNVQNIAYAERRDDGGLRVYFVARDDFLLIEPPESEQMATMLRELSAAQEPAPALPGTGKLHDIGSRVEELQRNIEETARKITPPGAA
jgi:hypothetical protein